MLNESDSGILTTIEKGNFMDEHGKGINIEHHDHDYHPHGRGYGYDGVGAGWGVFGIFGFIAFIVILWGVWAAHNRNSDHHRDQIDKHHDGIRATDQVNYQLGYMQKQLNDMQMEGRDILRKEDKIYDRQCKEYEESLRWGMPTGDHTQKLCTARPQYCGGPEHSRGGNFFNGSPVSENRSYAAEHCQMGV